MGCLVWVALGVLVLFSTIRLFFPPFNDDLGTMPTRRPYSWKKNVLNAIGVGGLPLEVASHECFQQFERKEQIQGIEHEDNSNEGPS